MRTRLRALGVGGVQARTFHSAAMKQLGYFWPRVVGGAPPRLVDNTFGMVANAAAGPGCGRAPASCATCCPSWSGRPAAWSGPRTTPPPRPGRPRGAVRPGRGRAGLRGLRRPEVQPGGGRLRGPAAADGRRARGERLRREEFRPATARSSSTSTRTSPRCSSGCSTPGSAARRPVRRRRRAADDLQLHRGHAGPPAPLPRALPRGDRGPAGARLPVHPQVVGLANGVIAKATSGHARLELSPSGRPVPSRCSPSTTTSRPRPAGSRPAARS
jgi:hypothetical protein